VGRVRRRYVVFNVVSDSMLNEKEVVREIWGELLALFGEVGVSYMELHVIEYDGQRGRGILRCTHKTVMDVCAGVTLISEIEGKPAAVNILGVSGSLRKAREIMMRKR